MSAGGTTPGRSATQGRWRWRLAGLVFVAAFLAQHFLGLHWRQLAALQAQDWFKYATGSALVLYLGWLWSLFARRLIGLRGRALGRTTVLHERSAALAPALLYLHSVQRCWPRSWRCSASTTATSRCTTSSGGSSRIVQRPPRVDRQPRCRTQVVSGEIQ